MASSSADIIKKSQRLSFSSENFFSSNIDDLIGPQRTINNTIDSQQTSFLESEVPLESIQVQTSRYTQPSSRIQIRPKPLLCPTESDLLKRFNAQDIAEPKKLYVDPRNIKDPETIRYYVRSINDYLNNSEYHGPHLRNFKQITSSEFQSIYKHLILRLIPDYQFPKRFDEAIPVTLKLINYPLSESIIKSLPSLGAIHSSSTFNGLLYFLVVCCRSLDLCEFNAQSEPDRFAIDRNGLSQLLHEYAIHKYYNYMNGEDDHSEPDKELAVVFENANKDNKRKYDEALAESNTLKEEIKILDSKASLLTDAKLRNQELNRDISKFNAYCEEKRRRIAKYENLNGRVNDELSRLNKQITMIEKEKTDIQEKLTKRNTSVEEIKKLCEDHDSLEEEYNSLASTTERATVQRNEKLEMINQLKSQIGKGCAEYNSKLSSVLPDQDLNVKFDPSGTTVKEILPTPIDNIMKKLELFEKELKSEFAVITKETLDLRDKLDILKTKAEDESAELERLENEIESLKNDYDDRHIKYIAENDKYNAILQEQNSNIEDKRIAARRGLFEAENKLTIERERYNSVKQKIELERQNLQKTIQNSLNTLIKKFEDMKEAENNLRARIEE